MKSQLLRLAWRDDCKLAISPDWSAGGYNIAPDAEPAELDGDVFRTPSQNLGTSDFALTCKLKTGSDVSTTQGIVGASYAGAVAGRYGFYIITNAIRCLCQFASGTYVFFDVSAEANTEYIISMIVDRKNSQLYGCVNGVFTNYGGSTSNIPPTGDFITVNKFRIGAYGSTSDTDQYLFSGTIDKTYVHLTAFTEGQIKAFHKNLGA